MTGGSEITNGSVDAELWPGSSRQVQQMRTISFQHLHLPEFGCYSHLHFYLQFGSDSIGCERRIFDGTSNGSSLREDSHVDSCMDRESTHTLASEKVFARAAKCSIAVASAHWWLV